MRRRPLESLRPDVVAKRAAFLKKVSRVHPERLVFIDESWLSVTMSRSHAWVKRGCEFIGRVPMNRGTNLTILGAIRRSGRVVLTTIWQTTNAHRFVDWLSKTLLPKLRRSDVVVMDNLRAHHDPRVAPVCEARGVRLLYQPPHSPDFNPIEPAWALQKHYVRKHAPRCHQTLRRLARRALAGYSAPLPSVVRPRWLWNSTQVIPGVNLHFLQDFPHGAGNR